MYGMASTKFSVQDSLERVWFLKETFLLVDTSIEAILGMFLLSFNNADVQFGIEKLT